MRQLVDSIMIDWNYDGVVMQPTVTDVPGKNEMVKGIYDIPEGCGTIKVKITDLLSESLIRHSENYEKYKPIDEKYRSIHWKGQKEKFREKHKDELDAFYAADKFLRSHLDGRNHSRNEWRKELAGLEEVSKSHDKTTEQCRSDMNELKSVREKSATREYGFSVMLS